MNHLDVKEVMQMPKILKCKLPTKLLYKLMNNGQTPVIEISLT